MVESPEGILPDALLAPDRKADVIAWLIPRPLPGVTKVQILRGWGQLTRTIPTKYDYDVVMASGLPGGAKI